MGVPILPSRRPRRVVGLSTFFSAEQRDSSWFCFDHLAAVQCEEVFNSFLYFLALSNRARTGPPHALRPGSPPGRRCVCVATAASSTHTDTTTASAWSRTERSFAWK